MANAIYPKAREAFLTGLIDWAGDDVKLVAVDAGYTYDVADEFLSDVGGATRVATSDVFTGKTTTDGIADADDVVLAAVTGDDIAGLVIYQDTGVEGTSRLILFLDTKTNASAIAITPTGDDVTITWSNGTNRIFKL